jgi:tetratricopeptide (TPR) repeat protein
MLANIIEAMRQGDHAAALKAAREAVTDQPDNAGAQHLLGVCLQRAGDLPAARAAFDAAIALAPDQAGHHFSLASLSLSEGRTAEAVAGLDQAIALDPNQLGAYVLLIHLALARGDQAEAEAKLKLAQRVNANHPQVLVAEGYVAQGRGDADLAMKCFTAAAQADPNLPAAQLALGMAFLGRGMWPFAEQSLSNALALDPSRPPTTLRALAEARRRQGKAEETVAALDELIALHPGDLAARALRAEIQAATGKPEAALPDYAFLLDQRPTHVATLRSAVGLFTQLGRGEEALVRAEAALAQAPDNDDLWMIRLGLSGRLQEDAGALLQRWLAASPASVACLDMLAEFHRARGEAAQALAFADRALAIDPQRYASNLVRLQAEMESDAGKALARAERMVGFVSDPSQERTVIGWAGMALDSLGRYDEAAERWRHMLRHVPDLMPPPRMMTADEAPAGEINGTLLWSPPGVRAEFVLRTAKAELGTRLRLDRIGSTGGGDGFGLVRYPPGHPDAGSAETWRASLVAAGLDPETAVDWVPHLDAYTLAALGGAQVVALLTDPRDAFLNWLINGSLQNYLPWPELGQAADWLAASLEALADHRDAHGDKVVLARLDTDAGVAAAAIEHALGLAQPLPALFGTGPRFPSGHWRHYAKGFADEFARLTAVSVRLGYPAG